MSDPTAPHPSSSDGPTRLPLAVRIARLAAGGIVVLVGVAMLVLPGPGLLVIVAGLAILARDVAWAARTLERVREHHARATDSVRRRTRHVGRRSSTRG